MGCWTYISWQSRSRTDIFLINNQALYQLSYLPSNLPAWLRHVGREEVAGAGIEPAFGLDAAYETAVPARAHPRKVTAAAGLEPAHTRLQDERSVYPFELRRKGGPGGTRTLTRSLQDFYAAFTSPARVEVMSDN